MTSDTPRYDAIGDLYRQYKSTATLPVLEHHLYTDLVGDVTGQRVLDLATGYGIYARLARDLGAAQVVGVDISPTMVQLARDAGPSDGIDYQVADARELPPLGTFDLVTAVWLFNYADSPEQLASMATSVRAALRPGGRLVALTINPGYDVTGPGWEPYGLTVDAAVPDSRRHRLEVALLTPTEPIPLSTSRWDADVYTEALTTAGLQPPTWHLPPTPETTPHQPDYWKTATDNPFLAGFTSHLAP